MRVTTHNAGILFLRQNGMHGLCEILGISEIAKNKNVDISMFPELALLYTAFFSQTAKK